MCNGEIPCANIRVVLRKYLVYNQLLLWHIACHCAASIHVK